MVPVLVLLTFAALIALDRLVLSKGYLEEKSGWPATLETLAPAAGQERVPEEVCLQPTYTWSRAGDRDTAALYLGVHPLLLGLVGAPCEMELREPGERVAKGETLLRLGCAPRGGGGGGGGGGARRLTVRSPVAGRVERVNRNAARTPPLEVERRGAPWVYRVRAEHAGVEAGWLRGDAALEWTRRQYLELRAYLHGAVEAGHVGPVMADGGALPAGILGALDENVWRGLEDRFLGPAAEDRA